MALTLEDIDDLLGLERGPIWVGELPFAVATKLGMRNHNVYLSLERAWHILDGHPDISKFDLLQLPFAISRGLLIKERAKPCIIASYKPPDDYRRFVTALKIAAQDCELWVSSFYRAHERQTRQHIKRGEILKTHD